LPFHVSKLGNHVPNSREWPEAAFRSERGINSLLERCSVEQIFLMRIIFIH
jgi:hypothetical protein